MYTLLLEVVVAPLRKSHLSATIPAVLRDYFDTAMRSRIDEIADMADVVSEAIIVIGANFAANLESAEDVSRRDLPKILATVVVDHTQVNDFMKRFWVATGNVELQATCCTIVAPCV